MFGRRKARNRNCRPAPWRSRRTGKSRTDYSLILKNIGMTSWPRLPAGDDVIAGAMALAVALAVLGGCPRVHDEWCGGGIPDSLILKNIGMASWPRLPAGDNVIAGAMAIAVALALLGGCPRVHDEWCGSGIPYSQILKNIGMASSPRLPAGADVIAGAMAIAVALAVLGGCPRVHDEWCGSGIPYSQILKNIGMARKRILNWPIADWLPATGY